MANIPLLTLKQILDGLLKWITANENDVNIPADEKWLYRNFNDVGLGTYDFLAQLKNIVLRTSKNARKLETRLMFDLSRANFPTIHIHLPQENLGSENSIGTSVSSEMYLNSDNTANLIYSRSFGSSYDLIITSDNDMEVVMIYEFLKRLFVSAADTLRETFKTFDFSGKELIPNYDVVPSNVYFRAITIKIDDTITTPSIVKIDTITDLNFTPVGVEEIDTGIGKMIIGNTFIIS